MEEDGKKLLRIEINERKKCSVQRIDKTKVYSLKMIK